MLQSSIMDKALIVEGSNNLTVFRSILNVLKKNLPSLFMVFKLPVALG